MKIKLIEAFKNYLIKNKLFINYKYSSLHIENNKDNKELNDSYVQNFLSGQKNFINNFDFSLGFLKEQILNNNHHLIKEILKKFKTENYERQLKVLKLNYKILNESLSNKSYISGMSIGDVIYAYNLLNKLDKNIFLEEFMKTGFFKSNVNKQIELNNYLQLNKLFKDDYKKYFTKLSFENNEEIINYESLNVFKLIINKENFYKLNNNVDIESLSYKIMNGLFLLGCEELDGIIKIDSKNNNKNIVVTTYINKKEDEEYIKNALTKIILYYVENYEKVSNIIDMKQFFIQEKILIEKNNLNNCMNKEISINKKILKL